LVKGNPTVLNRATPPPLRGRAPRGDGQGRLVVGFSERLVELLKEVRQLQALGVAVPKEVARTCADHRGIRLGGGEGRGWRSVGGGGWQEPR